MKSLSLRLAEASLLLLVSTMAAAPASADLFSSVNRLFKDWGLFQGLQINGSNDLTFQQNLVQGSESAYSGQRWDTDSFIRQSSLSLEGPIWKEFAFKADFSSSGYGSSTSSFVMGYVGKSTAVYYGDLNIDLSGNGFASFSESVKGWQLDQKIGPGLLRGFYSTTKSITRKQTISGNNTTGPYFLTYTPVMEGSETVKVNEQRMQFGVDYKLDYDSGQLYFEVEGGKSTIIPDTSSITVTYQSAGGDAQGSMLYGARLLMPLMHNRAQVGVTMIKQDYPEGNASDTVGYQEDVFTGSGSTGPFDVNFSPIIENGKTVIYKGKQQVIEQALLVLVDGFEKAENVDYDAYRSIGRIIFRSAVPATSMVTIRYYYDLSTDETVSDNALLGVDMFYHFSPQLSLEAEYGRSDGGSTANSGDALRTSLSYMTPKLRITGQYRNVAPTFTYMDSVSDTTRSRGLDFSASWEPIEHVSLGGTYSSLKSSEGYSFGSSTYYTGTSAVKLAQDGSTTSGLSVDTSRSDMELRLDFPNWPILLWEYQQLSNASSSSDSKYTYNNTSLNWSPTGKPYSISASYNQAHQTYLSAEDSTTSDGSDTQQLQWSASYRPSDKLSFSFTQSRNDSSALDNASSSSSSNDQVSVHWSPWSQLDINYDLTLTSSVGNTSSSLSSASTLARLLADGDNGDGGDDGSDTDEDDTDRYTDNSQRLSIRYSPSQKLSFDLGWSQREYTSGGNVGYLTDSTQTTRSISASYMLSEALSFSASYTNDRTDYLDEDRGSVLNNTTSLGANYRPPGSRWNFALNYNLTTGSSPTYSGYGSSQKMWIVPNDLSDIQARVAYTLSDTSEVSFTGQLADYVGSSNYTRQQIEVGYTHRLASFADLTFAYRYARNVSQGATDPRWGDISLTPGDDNYLVNTFMLKLDTQFNTGVGGRGSGMSGGSSSMRSFTGYRAGTSLTSFGRSRYGSSLGSSLSSGYRDPFSSLARDQATSQPQGYEVFGSGFSGKTGFNQGLGNISGQRQRTEDESAGLPSTLGEELLRVEDWQALDDLYSTWW
ncbi:hypothetical protein LLH23_11310 [bacterium]|nr:hypothetical protein [bacterium]